MTTNLVLTVIAEDEPGLVEKLASVISEHSGNWVDSAMSRLGGEFAGILKVTVPDNNAEDLRRDLAALQNEGITVTLRADRTSPRTGGTKAQFELIGQDHVGIVARISGVLASLNVNVDDLRTTVFTGSMSGEAMFKARAEIVLPDGLAFDEVSDALEAIAGDIMVDIEMREPGSSEQS